MSTPIDASTDAAQPVRVLVIDDEPQIRRFLDISLRAQGYRVASADTGRAGLDVLATHGADVVILDMGLPDMDGGAVLRELRQWSQVPVIVLTVRAAEAEKVAALDAGANDYVTKPFGVPELMARIRALLRATADAGRVVALATTTAGCAWISRAAWSASAANRSRCHDGNTHCSPGCSDMRGAW